MLGWFTLLHMDVDDAFEATQRGDIPLIAEFLANGADINAPHFVSRTLLHEAAAYDHAELVRYLLSCGANPNVRDINGLTPLMEAASGGDESTVRLLLSAGSRVADVDGFGSAAAGYARAQGYFHIAEILNQANGTV